MKTCSYWRPEQTQRFMIEIYPEIYSLHMGWIIKDQTSGNSLHAQGKSLAGKIASRFSLYDWLDLKFHKFFDAYRVSGYRQQHSIAERSASSPVSNYFLPLLARLRTERFWFRREGTNIPSSRSGNTFCLWSEFLGKNRVRTCALAVGCECQAKLQWSNLET